MHLAIVIDCVRGWMMYVRCCVGAPTMYSTCPCPTITSIASRRGYPCFRASSIHQLSIQQSKVCQCPNAIAMPCPSNRSSIYANIPWLCCRNVNPFLPIPSPHPLLRLCREGEVGYLRLRHIAHTRRRAADCHTRLEVVD
jgi:hypothetical protein